MGINRRSLIAGILASGFAPAAIGSGVLMPVIVRPLVYGTPGFAVPYVRMEGLTWYVE